MGGKLGLTLRDIETEGAGENIWSEEVRSDGV
jgi:hypothetical protein